MGKQEVYGKDNPIHQLQLFKSTVGLCLDKLGKAICKVSFESAIGRGYGTGVFCEIPHANGSFKGIATCCHVVNCREDFSIEFEISDIKLRITSEEIKWFFTDHNLDVTFFVFKMSDYVERYTNVLTLGSSNQVTKQMHVTVLQHPDGKSLSVSEGEVLSFDDLNVCYTSGTREGSSGAAVVNKDSKLFAIHKEGSESGLSVKNIGTLISNVEQAISVARPWENVLLMSEDVLDCQILEYTELQTIAETSLFTLKEKRINKTHYGNGFLCCLTLSDNVVTYGMFTNKHILLCKPKPNESFTVHFDGADGAIEIQSSDIVWVHANAKLHFTFAAFSAEFAKNIQEKGYEFLCLAATRPSAQSKFTLIQNPDEKPLVVIQGSIMDCSGDYLEHEGTPFSVIHGALFLNGNKEVIAVGNGCGCSRKLGTIITKDAVTEILKKANEAARHAYVKGLCKIFPGSMSACGFFCGVHYERKIWEGLFTQFNVIENKKSFEIVFSRDTNLKVQPHDIQTIVDDKERDFSFVMFKEDFMNKLREEGAQFLFGITKKPSDNSPIVMLHPIQGGKFFSDGNVAKNENDKLYYTLNSQRHFPGGVPILTDSFHVIAIHKALKPKGVNGDGPGNIATSMDNIISCLSSKLQSVGL